jgi:hypothetical protein
MLNFKRNYILFGIKCIAKIFNIIDDEIEIFYNYLITKAVAIC